MKIALHAAIAAFLAFAALPALAHEGHNHDAISFSAAYTRAMPPAAKTGGGFVTITNSGSIDDSLLMVTSPRAEQVQLHETIMVDDMMQMGPVEGDLVIPAGESLSFEPGGLHLMFMGVDSPFVEGEEVPVTLHFKEAGALDVILPVGPIGASEAPMMMDHMHDN